MRDIEFLLVPLVLGGAVLSAPSQGCAAPENPVTNGSFEILAADGFPADWERVGRVVEVTEEAHSGQRALRFERLPGMEPREETGLNRAWRPDSGERGRMLAQTKGGITFWYKALRAEKCTLTVQIIPMSERPFEDTGEARAIFAVPEEHIGDGQWHRGALKYDYSARPAVKWVHVSVRLLGGPGEMLFDDVEYVEKVGPLLRVSEVKLREDEARPGEAGTLTAQIGNVGDEEIRDLTLTLDLPPGLQADPPTQRISRLAVDDQQLLTWTLTGLREGEVTLRVRAQAGEVTGSASLSLAPDLRLVWFLTDQFLLPPGGTTTLRAKVENRGQAFLSGLRARLRPKAALQCLTEEEQAGPRLAPGQGATLVWPVRAEKLWGPSTVGLEVWTPDRPPQRAETRVYLTPTVNAPRQHLAGCLWMRSGPDRTLGEVRLRREGEWTTVAKMPWLARVVYQNAAGEPVEVTPHGGRVREGNHAIRYTAQVRDRDGGTWTFSLRVGDGPVTTPYEVEVKCDQPRQILAFEGPLVYVGEGTTKAAKTEALFPCLEWLVGEEMSSSTLDIKEGHPDQIRYLPHPNKVTIPFMAVALPKEGGGGAVGLLWDVHQRWDGEHDRPQPIFASPDRFEGRNCHLLGLMVPNVLTGLRENQRRAAQPYPLPANRPLRLQAHLYADPEAKDALTAMEAWFRTYRPDPPLPPPQGDYLRQVEFSMRAYLESLWISPEEGWLPFLGGPGIWRHPSHRADFCYDLLMAARITTNPQLAAQYRQRAEDQLQRGGGRARAEDLGFETSDPGATVLSLAARAGQLMDAQGEDGSWRFDADRKDTGVFKGKDYHELGPDNAAELGTCARSAYEILRYARISGDYEAYAAGVRALEFMQQFTVPRAAQVWEVPVHTPDILAAADAIDAYLEAYRFSGDERWLKEARRWARAGLPFVYVWNDERFPWMRYGSIPVFGASWHQWSWFGVLVQWNGLRYAYALLKLSSYDDGRWLRPASRNFWREVAVGITHSAMYQQSTEGRNLALWPDSYNTLNGGRAAWDFAPRQILKNVYTLIGREEEPQTVVLRPGEKLSGQRQPLAPSERAARVHITSGAEIVDAAWQEEQLRLTLRYPPQESGYTLIAGTVRPTQVRLDGRELAQRERLEEGEAPGWRYDERYALLTVRVTHDGDASLVLDGVRYQFRPFLARRVTTIAFEFDRDPEGWIAANHLTPLEVRDGVLVTTTQGVDPYMIRLRCQIEGRTVRTVIVRLRATGGQGGQFYWTTETSPTFAEDKVAHFALQPDGEWHEYRISVGDHPLWQGQTITAIRLDPGGGTPGARIEVDWIRGE